MPSAFAAVHATGRGGAAAAAREEAAAVPSGGERHSHHVAAREEAAEDMSCVVCLERRRTVVLVPCGHMVLCQRCCDAVQGSKNQVSVCLKGGEEEGKVGEGVEGGEEEDGGGACALWPHGVVPALLRRCTGVQEPGEFVLEGGRRGGRRGRRSGGR